MQAKRGMGPHNNEDIVREMNNILGAVAKAANQEPIVQVDPSFYLMKCFWIVCLIFGVYGAVHYKARFVNVALFAHIISLLQASVFQQYVHLREILFIALVLVYPHYCLQKEIKEGTMTPDTYNIRERQCCCGV